MADATITFSDGAPIFSLYRALQDAGYSNRDLDVGVFARDPKDRTRLGPRTGAADGAVDDGEVWQFAAERSDELAALLEGTLGVPIEHATPEAMAHGQRFLDTVLRPIVAKRFAATDPDYAAALAYGLFIFVQFPATTTLARLSAAARTKFLATYFPDAARYGLSALGATLVSDGGLNGIPFGHSFSFGANSNAPIDFSAAIIGAGFDSTTSITPHRQLLTMLQRAGLQPYIAEAFTPEAARNGCVLNRIAFPAVGVRAGSTAHLFLPGRINDALGARFPTVELSQSDLLSSYLINPFRRSQRNEALVGWARERSFSAATRVMYWMAELSRRMATPGTDDATTTMLRAAEEYPPFYPMVLLPLFGDEQAPKDALRKIDLSRLQPWLSPEGQVIASAIIAWRAEGFPVAHALLEPLLQSRPACATGHGVLAKMARTAGERTVAEHEYRQLNAALWPGQIDPAVDARLGQLLQQRGDLKGAISYFTSVATNPAASAEHRHDAYWHLIEIFRQSPDPEDPSYLSILKHYATALRQDFAGAPAKALDEERAKWGDTAAPPWPPTDRDQPAARRAAEAEVLATMADLYALAGELGRASELQERAARLAPQSGWFYADLVTLWAQQGAWDRVADGVGDLEGFVRSLETPGKSPPIKIDEDF